MKIYTFDVGHGLMHARMMIDCVIWDVLGSPGKIWEADMPEQLQGQDELQELKNRVEQLESENRELIYVIRTINFLISNLSFWADD